MSGLICLFTHCLLYHYDTKAGTDTSRYSLIWAILYLTAFPECQKKLRAEVDSVIGETEIASFKCPYNLTGHNM